MFRYLFAFAGFSIVVTQDAVGLREDERGGKVVELPTPATLHGSNSPISLNSPLSESSSNDPSSKDAKVTMHIIGDTHGDNNYLLRCLESTTRVVVDSTKEEYWVRWATGMSEDEVWEIVILGDMIDRGIRSRENLLILKFLAEDAIWGKRLVVLLGNHESMLLESHPAFADGPEYWSYAKRMEDLRAQHGTEGHALVTWLRQRPAVYFSHGLLMMHGGLSKLLADHVVKDLQCQHDCGKVMQDFINKISRDFLEGLHEFYLSDSRDAATWQNVSSFPYVLEAADSAKDGPGVLWYRGWSSTDHGAGTRQTCREAEQVGKYLGAHPVMVVAHTTHPRIIQFCQDSQVPIFAIDTHPSECTENHRSECDFDYRHDLHPKYLEQDYHRTEQLPQSLRMIQEGGHREFASCQDRNNVIICTTIRVEDFHDSVPMHPVFVPKQVIEVPMSPMYSLGNMGKRSELTAKPKPPPPPLYEPKPGLSPPSLHDTFKPRRLFPVYVPTRPGQ